MGQALARFVTLSILIGALLWSNAERVGNACLPALAAEMQWLDGSFRVQSLEVAREGGELVFRLAVGLARPVTVGGKTFYPDPRGQALSSTLVANVILPTVLSLAALFAWPGAHQRNYLFRLAVAVPSILLIATIGVPLTLLANLWRIVYEAANRTGYSPLVFWSDFGQNGGVNFLAIGVGALLAYLIERVTMTKASTTPDHSGNGTSACAGLPSVPSVAVCNQDEKRESEAMMPPPTVPNS
jgi:hypothetical protein